MDQNSTQSRPQRRRMDETLKSSIEIIRLTIRKQPFIIIRLTFWLVVWIMSIAHLADCVQFFRLSLDSVVPPNTPLPNGIEDSRRQSVPFLIMLGVLLTTLMPIIIVAPLFKVAAFLTYVVSELAWVSIIGFLLMCGGAGLAPTGNSPKMPTQLQALFSKTIGLTFTLFILLFVYSILLVILYFHHRGRGTLKIFTMPLNDLIYPTEDSRPEVDVPLPTDPEKGNSIDSVSSANSRNLPTSILKHPAQTYKSDGRRATLPAEFDPQTPTSGWDEDEDEDSRRHRLSTFRREKRKTKK
ncbi:uncharacterized protein MELLADRAFT_69357 [Melampsora larici-populina 98AG31]|uniref:Uncharacterized protein n=1 Tax=Melampsora larici-populina (strain 98AG31 / pathotype 3-4-7) TaxID=747676 RepID=F4SAF0_MELLP|nr:uncharacterized protein MELLADRAFT_69357 [Melampsora larici-populina 98AG31]EGF98375.1 hypothetical protein MELLADRAFT_69357 [Melampsora larici-populina 98AG31]